MAFLFLGVHLSTYVSSVKQRIVAVCVTRTFKACRACSPPAPHLDLLLPNLPTPIKVDCLEQILVGYRLDLSYLNTFIVRRSVKYKVLRCVFQLFAPRSFVFNFDLQQLLQNHTRFLAFKWLSACGKKQFYQFNVLPFALTSAPYVFTDFM